MDNSQETLNWLLKNAQGLSLKVEAWRWKDGLLPGYADYCVSLQIGGSTFRGHGCDRDESLALVKAAAEAIERYGLSISGHTTSNGFAAHSNFHLACEAAKNEIRERDLFLCHFQTSTPFCVDYEIDLATLGLNSTMAWFNSLGVKVTHFRLGDHGSICLMDGRRAKQPFGFTIGGAYKGEIEKSVVSSTIEATRNAYFAIRSVESHISLSMEDFLRVKRPTFREHGALGLDLKYAASVEFLFTGDSQISKGGPLPDNGWETRQIYLRDIPDCPIAVAVAHHPEAQSLYVGLPKASDLNLARLRNFSIGNASEIKISTIPHPYY